MSRERICAFFVFAFIGTVIQLGIADDSIAQSSGSSLSPTRVVIPAGEKSASVTLKNNSSVEMSYRMGFVEMGLDNQGRFRLLEKHELHPKQRSAKPIVRFSPRQVRLKPGASQVVRAIVRRAGLKPGEYRSHMTVRALPVLSGIDLTGERNAVLIESSSSTGVGVSIPVIVRHQDTSASVKLSGSSVLFNKFGKNGKIQLALDLHGNRSAYGDFVVSLVNGNKERIIGELKSFALFYPYPNENVTIRMREDVKRTDFSEQSKLRIKFENRAIDDDTGYWVDELSRPAIQ